MCSRLRIGSASTPASVSTLVAAVATRSWQQLGVVHDLRIRRRERLHDRQRPAGGAARRVERELGGVAQPLDARAVLAPLGQALRPLRRLRPRQTPRASGRRGAPRPR